MMHEAIALAAAVTTLINDGSYSQPVTATRAYVVEHDLKALGDLKVSVVPGEMDTVNISRKGEQHDIVIDVAIQKRVPANDLTKLDELMLLAKEIRTYVNRKRVAAGINYVAIRTSNKPLYNVKHLKEDWVLTTVLQLTFRGCE